MENLSKEFVQSCEGFINVMNHLRSSEFNDSPPQPVEVSPFELMTRHFKAFNLFKKYHDPDGIDTHKLAIEVDGDDFDETYNWLIKTYPEYTPWTEEDKESRFKIY